MSVDDSNLSGVTLRRLIGMNEGVLTPNADDYPPLSALNDLLFCERRCALHRNEQIWVDNFYTAEGTARHRRAHDAAASEDRATGAVVRGMDLVSHRLRLVGKGDVVEFHLRPDGPPIPLPVEYKRGKRRRWDNDDVQLCAQAICLEEMLGVHVPVGAVFHVQSKRRREVQFDERLRALTEEAARRLHELLASEETPAPIVKPRCKGCSLRDLCQPTVGADRRRIEIYLNRLYIIEPERSVPLREG